MKISTFVIAIVVVGMIVAGITMFAGEIATNYTTDYDNSTFTGLDRTAEVKNLTQDMFDDLNTIDTTSSVLDIVGGFLKSGYTVIKVTFASFGLFREMSGEAFTQVPALGMFGSYLFVIAFITFVFIVISILVNREA